ncbi:amidase [uncultured Ornithinimicrobium sp.]|uniref:amidase n=1 Tax=uncultured Ornithinimicrobium sp. TaxID=259307 RepID=UPI002592707D|nr:amidase family protein [uncultured Ornithinimicrobium sp.]
MTADTTELAYLGAAEALRLFHRRELSPVEVLRAQVARTEQVDGVVNAFTETLFEEALAGAREAEARYRAGDDIPPLLGLTVATKEKHALAGRTLSQGLVACRDDVATQDHPVVSALRRSGAVIHARTTSPELSCATVTHSRLWGVTRNPWNTRYSPGGSSGGSGAALAAGMTTLATASDIAGSTRVPAASTGTVGFKAPYGRIPGQPPLSADHYRGDGPMGRSVADVALLTNALAGRHPADHTSLWPATTVGAEPADPAGLRVALCVRLGDYPVDTEVEAATRAVAGALESAGALVEEIELPWTSRRITEIGFTHFGYILGPAIAVATQGHEHLADYTRRFIADARAAAERHTFLEGLTAEAQVQGELAAAMAPFDVLLCPTNAIPALEADESYTDGIVVGERRLEHYWESHLTLPFNIANRCPVLAVPSGRASTGVPTGVQIVGHPYDDGRVFAVGALVEQLRPWSAGYAELTQGPH